MAKSKKKRKKKNQEKITPVAPIVKLKKIVKGVGIVFGLLFLILIPSIVFHLVTNKYFPIPVENILWKSVGYIGTVIIGIVSLVSVAFGIEFKRSKEKPSQKFYIGVYSGITVGVCVLLLGCFLMYGSIFSEQATSIYFLNLFLMILLGLSYLLSRSVIVIWLRLRGRSKTYIRKNKKGMNNYWWYEEIHKEHNLGVVYYLNKWFTVIFPVTFALAFFLGCFKPITYITAALFTILCVIMMVLIVFQGIIYSHVEDGSSSSDLRVIHHSIIARFLGPVFFAACIVLEWLVVLGMIEIL